MYRDAQGGVFVRAKAMMSTARMSAGSRVAKGFVVQSENRIPNSQENERTTRSNAVPITNIRGTEEARHREKHTDGLQLPSTVLGLRILPARWNHKEKPGRGLHKGPHVDGLYVEGKGSDLEGARGLSEGWECSCYGLHVCVPPKFICRK